MQQHDLASTNCNLLRLRFYTSRLAQRDCLDSCSTMLRVSSVSLAPFPRIPCRSIVGEKDARIVLSVRPQDKALTVHHRLTPLFRGAHWSMSLSLLVAITRAELPTRIQCYAAHFRRQKTICNSPSSARTQLFAQLYACLVCSTPKRVRRLLTYDQIFLQMVGNP